GGKVARIDQLRLILVELCGPIEVDQAVARSWNLSYLASHSPVLRCRLGRGTTELAGTEWTYSKTLQIFPWLGVVSIDYVFASPESMRAVMEMYDSFVEWKNGDYLPYLRQCGAMSPDLVTHSATMPTSPEHNLHAGLVIELRHRLKDHLSPRPVFYAFH